MRKIKIIILIVSYILGAIVGGYLVSFILR